MAHCKQNIYVQFILISTIQSLLLSLSLSLLLSHALCMSFILLFESASLKIQQKEKTRPFDYLQLKFGTTHTKGEIREISVSNLIYVISTMYI